jgi:xanthine dehydrogenase molybdopterin-binding subunit B
MLSQVEVNLLTGETTILQTDIIYDCGQSLNPAVDLGQVCLVLTHVLLKISLSVALSHTHTL